MQWRTAFRRPLWAIIFTFLLAASFFFIGVSGMLTISPAMAAGLGLFCFIAAMCILAYMIGDAIYLNRRESKSGVKSVLDRNASIDKDNTIIGIVSALVLLASLAAIIFCRRKKE